MGDYGQPRFRARDLPQAEAGEHLHTRLRRFRLDTALAKIGYISTTFGDSERRTKLPADEQQLWLRTINPHGLAYLAKALIQVSNDHRSGDLTFADLVDLCQLYNRAQGAEYQPGAGLPEITQLFIRMSYQQRN